MPGKSALSQRLLPGVVVCMMAAAAAYQFLRPAPEKSVVIADGSGVDTELIPDPPQLTASDTAYAVPSIPFEEADWVAPFRGAEQWHNANMQEIVAFPEERKPQPALDVYVRSSLRWDALETAENTYDFSPIDALFREAIAKKQKVGFGLMTLYPGQPTGLTIAGARLAYPKYVHDRLQSGPEEEKDFISPEDATVWVPNYNSDFFLSRFEALLQALANHIQKTSYNKTRYAEALGYVDIRGFGSWGEWHMANAVSRPERYPPGRRPAAKSLKRIVDAHVHAFNDVPLVAIISAFDAEKLPNTLVPAEVGYHVLSTSNRWGKIGWRRDNWGWREDYISGWLEKNSTVFKGMRFDTAIMNRWKYAPVLGEGPCGGTAKGGPCPFFDIPRQVRFYHASMIGNGNFCGEHRDIRGRDSIRMAWKWSGYRISIQQVVIDKRIRANGSFRVRIDWQNTGVAPLYEHWDTWVQLEDPSTGRVVWSGKSKHALRLKLPSAKAYAMEDQFPLPSTVPAGRYALSVVVKDPSGYRDPLPLAVPGRRANGSYLVIPSIEITKS